MGRAAQGDSLRSGTSGRSDSRRGSIISSLPHWDALRHRLSKIPGQKTGRRGIWSKSHSGAEGLGEENQIAAGRGWGGWGRRLRFAPALGKPRAASQVSDFLICVGKKSSLHPVLRNYLNRRGEGGALGGGRVLKRRKETVMPSRGLSFYA